MSDRHRGSSGASPELSPTPPSSADSALIAALREDLTEAGFTNDGVAEILGPEAVAALGREQVVPGQLRVLEVLEHLDLPSSRESCSAAGADSSPESSRHTSGPWSPETGVSSQQWKCAVLTALWLVSVPVTAEQVEAALPRTGVAGLQRLNLAELNAGGFPAGAEDANPPASTVLPTCDLRPYQVETRAGGRDMWVTSDLGAHQVQGALPHDHVLGVGQASLTLAGITHRRPVQTALDIGTGCGIQLLHLLDHAEHVTGTDLSDRALKFARFNLLLNAPALELDPQRLDARVELLQGSLLEPVAGRTFDLVVSNPPFVITPRQPDETEADRYVYRDGGRQGDALMQELIVGLPAVLNPGGIAQMLGNWEIRLSREKTGACSGSAEAIEDCSLGEPYVANSGTWDTRPRAWVENAGLNAWFIQRDLQTPAEYAETWLRDASEERSIHDYRRRYAEYLADFASRGVAQIGFGLIWVQKPHADPGAAAAGSWRRFEELTDEVLQPLGPVIGKTTARAVEIQQDAASVLQSALTVVETVTEERYQRFGAEHPEVIIARQGAGLRRARPISSAAAGFLAAADGEFTAAQLITAVCSLTETDEDSLTQEVLDLYTDGFLTTG